MIEGRITREDWLFYSDLFGPWRTYADRVHTLLEIARNPIRAEGLNVLPRSAKVRIGPNNPKRATVGGVGYTNITPVKWDSPGFATPPFVKRLCCWRSDSLPALNESTHNRSWGCSSLRRHPPLRGREQEGAPARSRADRSPTGHSCSPHGPFPGVSDEDHRFGGLRRTGCLRFLHEPHGARGDAHLDRRHRPHASHDGVQPRGRAPALPPPQALLPTGLSPATHVRAKRLIS